MSAKHANTPAEQPERGSEQKQGLLRRAVALIGPGVIAGAADDDPTGIATYAQAGAQTGYGLLWTTLLTLPMMATVQYIAAKVGIVHRTGLAGVLKARFPAPVLYVAVLGLLIANVINAGVDIGAVAAALHLMLPVSATVLVVVVALLILGFLVFGNYRIIQNTFKWLTLALMAYIISSFLAKPDWLGVLKGTVIPSFSLKTTFLSLFVATLGGNISPYLFFWQADLEVGSMQPAGSAIHARRIGGEIKNTAWDTIVGMIFSNLVIYFIEIATAATLFRTGKHNVTSAVQAAEALRPLLGNGATILWAIGMVGAGVLAIPALTGSTADAVATVFGWRHGLARKVDRAKRFYGVLAVIMVIGMAINFLHINPIQALVLSATLNGFLTPPLLILLLLVANNKQVMGERTNGKVVNVLGWGTTGIMILGAIALLFTF